MAQTSELKATVRQRAGKGAAREARRNNQVPAVIYGNKQDPSSILLPYKETALAIFGGGFLTNVITIDVDGKKEKVIPRDYQLDPVRDFVMHVDFLRVGRNTVVTVEIPAEFINEDDCPGLTRGGVLNVVRHAIEVNCPADSIPDSLVCDLKGLDIGDGIHISAVNLPEGVEPTITDRDFTIATIAAPAGLKEESSDEDGEAAEDDAASAD